MHDMTGTRPGIGSGGYDKMAQLESTEHLE